MRAMDTTLLNYFLARKTVIEETLIWVYARNPVTNVIEGFGFWTGDNTVSITVRTQTGTDVLRQYTGSGTIVTTPVIVGTPSLATQNALTFEFSGIITFVEDCLRGKNLRNAGIEIHKIYRDEATDLLIRDMGGELVYIGQADGVSKRVNALTYEGGTTATAIPTFALDIIPHIRGFRRNNKTRSNQTGRSRSDDAFYKFTNVSWLWQVRWGKRKKGHKGKRNRHGGDDRRPQDPDVWGRD